MSRWGSLPPWSRRTWGRAAGAAVIAHPVGRAADELAATGATARPRRRLASEPLTSQETRVALLVARGLSNREVAAGRQHPTATSKRIPQHAAGRTTGVPDLFPGPVLASLRADPDRPAFEIGR
ncbi:MAG TPA: hypothetical protein VF468_25050 [Actinomycetota bacterium]|nr:hypothetical protein [Actinomycetota bacterium]